MISYFVLPAARPPELLARNREKGTRVASFADQLAARPWRSMAAGTMPADKKQGMRSRPGAAPGDAPLRALGAVMMMALRETAEIGCASRADLRRLARSSCVAGRRASSTAS